MLKMKINFIAGYIFMHTSREGIGIGARPWKFGRFCEVFTFFSGCRKNILISMKIF